MALNELVYLLAILIEIVFLAWAAAYLSFLVYSWLKGAPYVATQNKEIQSILEQEHLKPHQFMIELGCGDGRILRQAAQTYRVKGLGIDINPLTILKARVLAGLTGTAGICFQIGDIRHIDLSRADVIYIYLFPKLVAKLQNQLLHQTKKNALIIAHGFKIPYLSAYSVRVIQGDTFHTYYYRVC